MKLRATNLKVDTFILILFHFLCLDRTLKVPFKKIKYKTHLLRLLNSKGFRFHAE